MNRIGYGFVLGVHSVMQRQECLLRYYKRYEIRITLVKGLRHKIFSCQCGGACERGVRRSKCLKYIFTNLQKV